MNTDADLLNRGKLFLQRGEYLRAEEVARQLLQTTPNNLEVIHLLGVTLRRLGMLPESVEQCRKVLEIDPRHAEVNNDLGIALASLGQWDEAISAFSRFVERSPDVAEARNNLGNAMRLQGRIEEAIVHLREAVRLKPDYLDAYNNLAAAFVVRQQWNDVIACYRQVVRLKPADAKARSNLGIVLADHGTLEEAIDQFREATRLDPMFAEAHCNLGIAFYSLGRLEEALAAYEDSLRVKPQYPMAIWSRAVVWLLLGKFPKGWRDYEWRWQAGVINPHSFPEPIWDGSPLAGRTIILHAEQGLGDTIQFIRYAPLVKRQGGTVLFQCPPPLIPLVRSCAAIDDLIPIGTPLPAYDLHAPLLSLPGIFQTKLETIPRDVPYLHPGEDRVAYWRNQLASVPGLRVGIAWQGNRNFKLDRWRSIPLVHYERLARVKGVQLLSLQKNPGAEQLLELRNRFSVIDLGNQLDLDGGFLDTPAVMKNLDLVVTSCTAIAHAAGAVGVPVWVALSAAPDWRWLLEREDSPWYPSMRLFRQRQLGEWGEVFERMAEELWERVNS